MTSIAQPARPARSRTRPRSATRAPAKRKQRLLGGGVLWIVLFAVLLAGVVAVNVAVLRLNVELDGAGRERAQLKADIATLRAELSSTAATARIERVATEELGLVEADPATTTYLSLSPR
jgi:cell division protein FtsL